MTVEFAELPPNGAGGKPFGKWFAIAQELRERPMQWAKVSSHATQSAAAASAGNLKSGKYRGIEAGEFEATTRGKDLWARYVGGIS